MTDALLIDAGALRESMRLVVEGFGSKPDEVALVADNLVDANLAGHDSHGIGMLPRYTEAFLEGGLKPNTHVKTLLDAGALLRLDGDQGFGQVIGREAMALGIERATSLGTAIVALGRSHHLGRIGHWAEQAAAAGIVSLHFVNVIARPIVAPHGGAKAGFGTNPFTAGFPLPGRAPFILDFATSQIAQGKTRVAFNKGELLAEPCVIDDHGRPSREPRWSVIEPWGAILPFGGTSAHKGYGMAVLCELLGGALAAGLVGHRADGSKKQILNGMLSVLIDPRAFDNAEWEAEALAFVDNLRSLPPRDGFDRVRIAGEPERAMRAERLAQGVPVDRTTWTQILTAADRLGVGGERVARAARVA